VSLVNDRISEFDDGRTTYLDTLRGSPRGCSVGDPIPTLARLGTALLSETAFDRILTPSRVDSLLSGTTAFDTLRLGRQLGWLSDAEQNYDDLRKRYEQVSASLLSSRISEREHENLVSSLFGGSRFPRDSHQSLRRSRARSDDPCSCTRYRPTRSRRCQIQPIYLLCEKHGAEKCCLSRELSSKDASGKGWRQTGVSVTC